MTALAWLSAFFALPFLGSCPVILPALEMNSACLCRGHDHGAAKTFFLNGVARLCGFGLLFAQRVSVARARRQRRLPGMHCSAVTYYLFWVLPLWRAVQDGGLGRRGLHSRGSWCGLLFRGSTGSNGWAVPQLFPADGGFNARARLQATPLLLDFMALLFLRLFAS